MILKTAITISFLTGLGMIFLGARFLLFPDLAEAGYCIRFNEAGDYSFHYIKGIRDIFSGITICLLVLARQPKALSIVMLAGTIIPMADLFIVISKDYTGLMAALPHLVAILVCSACGSVIMNAKDSKQDMNVQAFVRLIKSAQDGKLSIMEMNILPGEKTPWHYHTLFSETFKILSGTLEVGWGRTVLQLMPGEAATIAPNEKHYYHNISDEQCILRVIINPGNENFEKSMFILKGLVKGGLATKAGVPRKVRDLALFVYLSNSRMIGMQKIAEPLFSFIAKVAIKRRYLDELESRYYIEQKQQ